MTDAKNEAWLRDRLTHLQGLKSPTRIQQTMLKLAARTDRTPEEEKTLAAMVSAERAAEKAQKARIAASKVLDRESHAERKKRDHELYRSAGLMAVAGVVDRKTGMPVIDRGVLVGALAELTGNPSPERLTKLKARGDALLHEAEGRKSGKS